MRTKGATSCVFVRLSDLVERFQPDAIIPISRQFANQNNLKGYALYSNRDNIIAAGNQPAVQERADVTEHAFDENEPIYPEDR